MLFSLSGVEVLSVPKERLSERVTRLLAKVVADGAYPSATSALEAAELTSGWLGELRKRERVYYANPEGPPPTMRGDKAQALAAVLNVSIGELLGGTPDELDPAEERLAAVKAARNLQYSEAAIAEIEQRSLLPLRDRHRWLEEIEKAQGGRPAPRVGSQLSELPRDSQRGR